MQIYSDPCRELETNSLPDAEIWEVTEDDHRAKPLTFTRSFAERHGLEDGLPPVEPGWYYWYCQPGCLPDSEKFGPFATEAEAVEDMRKSE